MRRENAAGVSKKGDDIEEEARQVADRRGVKRKGEEEGRE